MQKKNFFRKNQAVVLLLLVLMLLPGCKNSDAENPVQEDSAFKEDSTVEEDSAVKEDSAAEKEAESIEKDEKKLWAEDEKGCFILEDESYIYSCSSYRLVRVDKETGEEKILWESINGRDSEYLYSQGEGLLLQDKIYFIEAWINEDETVSRALSVVGKDGTGYRQIEQLWGNSDYSLTVLDGILHVNDLYQSSDSDQAPFTYPVYEDGSLCEAERKEEKREDIGEGYNLAFYYDNGVRTLSPAESRKNLGVLLLRNENYELAMFDMETGERIHLPKEFVRLSAYNDRYFLSDGYGEVYLIDRETMAVRKLMEADAFINIITMDEDYVYTEYDEENTDGEREFIYEKVSVETGERSLIFKQKASDLLADYDPFSGIIPVVKNGYLYYAGCDDYKLYLMRRSLSDPAKEEKLGKAFFDSGIGEVGTLKAYHERVYSEIVPDMLLIETDLEWLKVDERFAGADKINRYLEEEQNKNREYENENIEWMEERLKEDEESLGIHYSYSSKVSEIAYFDEHYLSFCQQEYDYMGGAHGMPLWIGMTFDLQSGQRLVLEDVIGNSEEELKEIVTEYFAEYIGRNPEYFWADAIETVKEEADFDLSFYLTADGIKFYFHPYALACYAAGFQEVTIPYDEFSMKIRVGEGVQ